MLDYLLVRLTNLHWMLPLKVKLPIILGFNLGSLIIILKSGILHMKLIQAINLAWEIDISLGNLIKQRGLMRRLILRNILVRRHMEVLLQMQISLFFLVLKLLVH